MLLVACHNQKTFSPDEVQSYVYPVAKSNEPERQVSLPEPEMDSNLCISGERIIVSFKFEDSDKILTIVTAKELDYLVCRMGTKEAIELEFPKNKINSWDQFCYQYYSRGGGFQNIAMTFDYLCFETDSFEYTVFHKSYAVDEDQYENDIGLVITDKESIREKGEADATKIVMKGNFNSMMGSLDKLRDTKIKKNFG